MLTQIDPYATAKGVIVDRTITRSESGSIYGSVPLTIVLTSPVFQSEKEFLEWNEQVEMLRDKHFVVGPEGELRMGNYRR